MKALTGLPTPAYLKVSEQANIRLSSLLTLVQELEAGRTPAYLAHYRPDITDGLDEDQLRDVEQRLRDFLDLEDRRITILTAIGQQNRLTPELRTQIESAMDRWELEDLYFPFKPKRKTAADEAMEKGLEPLARFLWDQQPPHADITTVARPYVDETRGVCSVPEALRLARHIVARWLGEDAEIRRDLRKMMYEESEIVVLPRQASRRDEAADRRFKALVGYRAKVRKAPWRQMLAIRRAEKEGGVRYEIVLPENKAVVYLLSRLIQDRGSLFCLQLGAAAREAFETYLAPTFRQELTMALNERCDSDAIRVFRNNLRKLLMTPPAGRIGVIGLEITRPGGWRAAVIDLQGQFVEGAIVYPPSQESEKASSAEEKPDGSPEQTAAPPEESAASEDGSAEAEAQPAGGSETSKPESEPPSNDDQRPPAEAASSDAEAAGETKTASSEADASESPRIEPPGAASGPESQAETPREGEPEPDKTETDEGVPEPEPRQARKKETAGRPVPKSGERPDPPPYVPLAQLLTKHDVSAIVMPNGPGIRQAEKVIRSALREAGSPKVFWTTFSEAGSWIYATSRDARREMPGLEPALRSAVCLARRLQDPLAELIRVDPRVLGLGQHHHEVDQRRLRTALRATAESTAHRIGVDLNSASIELLSCVAGLTERLAKRIVEHRRRIGRFTRREQLRDVTGLNDRIYKQAAGFVRIPDGDNPLDRTAVHPDMYPAAEKILAAAGLSVEEALDKPEALESPQLEELQDKQHPLDLLRAVVKQFRESSRDPRGEFTPPEPPVELLAPDQLKAGTKVEGVVANIADFGAFVDIGADQDGLVHVSQFSDEFVKDPKAAVKVGDRVSVYILAVEDGGRRISLSMKPPQAKPRRGRRVEPRQQRADARRSNGARRRRKEPQREAGPAKRTFGPDERAKAREAEEVKRLSLEEKLALLETKYRTKV